MICISPRFWTCVLQLHPQHSCSDFNFNLKVLPLRDMPLTLCYAHKHFYYWAKWAHWVLFNFMYDTCQIYRRQTNKQKKKLVVIDSVWQNRVILKGVWGLSSQVTTSSLHWILFTVFIIFEMLTVNKILSYYIVNSEISLNVFIIAQSLDIVDAVIISQIGFTIISCLPFHIREL